MLLLNSMIFLLIVALFMYASSLGSFLAGATGNAKGMFVLASLIVVVNAIIGAWVWANNNQKGDK